MIVYSSIADGVFACSWLIANAMTSGLQAITKCYSVLQNGFKSPDTLIFLSKLVAKKHYAIQEVRQY